MYEDGWARIDFIYVTYQRTHWRGLKVHVEIQCITKGKCLPYLSDVL